MKICRQIAVITNRTMPLVIVVMLVACSKPKNLFMDTPALYSSAGVDIDRVTDEAHRTPAMEIMFATDRHFDAENPEVPFTEDRDRGLQLQVGVAKIRLGEEGATWAEIAETSSAMKRQEPLLMHVENIDNFGPLADTVWDFHPSAKDPEINVPRERLAETINARLATSRGPDIVVYVAPFKVNFNQALYTAAEFNHYLGRDGVFVAYSWPTATGTLDYFAATENAYLTVNNLRIFLEYLARETNAEKIHLMTYSAGARVLGGAMQQLRLQHNDLDEAEVKDLLRIGHVVFTGPDIDAGAFGAQYRDGAGELADSITIYTMKRDRALATSKFLFGFNRLGSIDINDFNPYAIDYLQEHAAVSFVAVTEAENANKDNAHGYFRSSPWVSTDILLNIGVGLSPDERCLTRDPGEVIWQFPENYREAVEALVDRVAERGRSAAGSP